MQYQLQNVQQIQASFATFAAFLGDGSVVTIWGDAAEAKAVATLWRVSCSPTLPKY